MSGIKLKEIKPGMAIHCKTQEEAKMLAENSSLGKCFGAQLFWDRHDKNTCYSYEPYEEYGRMNDIWHYCYYDWYKEHAYEITEFEDLIIEDGEESESMDISVEKIEESLRVIREVCKSHEGCKDCPLRKSESLCYVTDLVPGDWVLKTDKDTNNRIFR